MSEPGLRPLASGDLAEAFALSSTAGWNQALDDWRLLLALAPDGSFAAVGDGRIVGTAMAIDYQGFAWIAMMLVDPAWRGRGVGRRLLEAAIESVPSNRPIRLDATPMGRPLYLSYGFEDESPLTRYVTEASTQGASAAEGDAGPAGVRALTVADLPRVIACDRQVFGGDRAALLRLVRDRAPQYAWIVSEPGAGLPRSCFGRRGRLFDQIGPVIAGDEAGARALVSAALRGVDGRAAQLDVFDGQGAFAAWLLTRGFRVLRPLFRMRRPAPPHRAQNARRGAPGGAAWRRGGRSTPVATPRARGARPRVRVKKNGRRFRRPSSYCVGESIDCPR